MTEELTIPFDVISARNGKTAKLLMQSLLLTGKIIPIGASLLVEHVFVSNEKKPTEIIYSFGLPRDATLRRFKVKGKDFLVESKLEERDKVEKIYEQAIEKGNLAVKVQRFRDGVVNLFVGNIKPLEEVKVYLEILAGVDLWDNGFRFRFPFTLAPCYHKNARTSVIGKDTGEIELPNDDFGYVVLPQYKRDASNLHSIGFNLLVEVPNKIFEISSPSHPIKIHQINQNASNIVLAIEKDIPNRDLVLDVKTKEPIEYVVSQKDSKGKVPFFAVFPSQLFKQTQFLKNKTNVVFVLDRSGSMSGVKLEQAKRALKACLSILDKDDKFSIIAFESDVQIFSNKLLSSSKENIEKAISFLDEIEASGGTELGLALNEASHMLKASEIKEGNIFVITDGEVYGTEDIIKEAKETNIKINCLGIGSSSQDRFINLLARETGGESAYITPQERVENAALKLFSSVKTDVATIKDISFKSLDEIKIENDFERTIYDGKPLVLFGEARNYAKGNIEFTLLKNGKEYKKELPLNIESKHSESFIKLLIGARLIDTIESSLGSFVDNDPETKNLYNLLKSQSKKYRLASRAMGLIAVLKRKGDKNNMPITHVVPLGLPQDTLWGAYFEEALQSNYDVLGAPTLSKCEINIKKIAQEKVEFNYGSNKKKEDEIYDLASQIQLDGGIEGNTEEERIKKTIIALFKFVENGNTVHFGPLKLHVQKIVKFLKKFEKKYKIISKVISIAESKMPLPESWNKINTGDKFWVELEQFLAN